MSKLSVLFVGKTEKQYQNLRSEYIQKIKPYHPISVKELRVNYKRSGNIPARIKSQESEKILAEIDSRDKLVLLDQGGKMYDSRAFAQFVKKIVGQPVNTTFLIGGAYGVHKDVAARANHKISLSKMTFTHQMVRPIFLEQLYRAFTIMSNKSYHH